MSKDRNILCEYYINSTSCKLGKRCNIYKEMQNCTQYKKDDKRKYSDELLNSGSTLTIIYIGKCLQNQKSYKLCSNVRRIIISLFICIKPS